MDEMLAEPCPNSRHGGFFDTFPVDVFNPDCQTCSVRKMLAEHDHLHLGADWKSCQVEGIGGVPGEMVKCSCGSYHH